MPFLMKNKSEITHKKRALWITKRKVTAQAPISSFKEYLIHKFNMNTRIVAKSLTGCRGSAELIPSISQPQRGVPWRAVSELPLNPCTGGNKTLVYNPA